MDSLIKTSFKTYDAAGLGIKNAHGTFLVENQASLKVDVSDVVYNRVFKMRQRMTFLGLSRAVAQEGYSSLDGVNKEYLQVNGELNFKAVASELKTTSGVQTQVNATHVAQAQAADWRDNQTALLINCLRYAVLKRLEEDSVDEDLTGYLPGYNDGHVIIDQNAHWPLYYPQSAGVTLEWPGGNDEANYPGYNRVQSIIMEDFGQNVISLENMSTPAARFILAMCGAWERKSRYSLDFSSPMLSEAIHYRRRDTIDMNAWLAPEIGVGAVVPVPLTSGEAMAALREFVARNKLYNNYSDALAVVSEVMLSMVPDTAEGQAWLQVPRTVVMPTFFASRARYPFLIDGEAALINHRAFNEFHFIGNSIERIFLAANIKTMAAMTGLYARSLRRMNEDAPADILLTNEVMINGRFQYSAAVSESLRTGVPVTGASGAYVVFENVSDGVFQSNILVEVNVPRADGYVITNTAGRNVLTVSHIPPPGVPLLILPLPVFGESGPFALRGAISFENDDKDRRGVNTHTNKAYEYAWLARLCGEDVETKKGEWIGPQRFFASNEGQFVYNLMATYDSRGDLIKVINKKAREHHFIPLPNIHTKMAKDEIKYELRMVTMGVKAQVADRATEITDLGGSLPSTTVTSVNIETPSGIKKLMGYIRRTQQDFRWEETDRAGVIPVT